MDTINKMMWTFPLATRFVNEYRLPIPVNNEELFWYHINMLNDEFDTINKWNSLIEVINRDFDGNPNAFTEGFLDVRETVIQAVKNNPAYIKFNEMDMTEYAVDKTKYKQKSKNIYNESNIGKHLISIDLRKANFQAMNYIDKEIMFNSDNYQQFIKKFTDIPLIVNSKYFRQVFFGQLNPSRVFTVENYMVYQILDYIIEKLPFKYEINSINNDEVVLSYDHDEYSKNVGPNSTNGDILTILPSMLIRDLGIDVCIEFFTLDGYNFYSNKRNRKHFTFYAKKYTPGPMCDNVMNTELMCVNGQFYSLTYKLFHNLQLCEEDYHFVNCDVDCIFNDTFRIEKINAN